MGTKRNSFRKTDAARLVRAVTAAGLNVTSVECIDGKLKVNTGAPAAANDTKQDELSEWMRGHHGTNSTQRT